MDKVVAITVTFNSSQFLNRLICSLLEQTYPVDKIIIVDNNSEKEHKYEIEKIKKLANEKIDIIWLDKNTGGAGGFCVGMTYTYENYNPDWYWIMDDDAFPVATCLNNLIASTHTLKNIGFVAPLIYGIDRQSFQLYHHKKFGRSLVEASIPFKKLNEVKKNTEIDANAFVGPLFSAQAVGKVGVADPGLFIYGDDTEYTYRVTRYFKGYVCPSAVINHCDPQSNKTSINPKAWWKDYYEYRNKLLFIKKYHKSVIEYFTSSNVIIYRLLKNIIKTATYDMYKGYRMIRIKLLIKALVDGLKGKKGKTIDPVIYMEQL